MSASLHDIFPVQEGRYEPPSVGQMVREHHSRHLDSDISVHFEIHTQENAQTSTAIHVEEDIPVHYRSTAERLPVLRSPISDPKHELQCELASVPHRPLHPGLIRRIPDRRPDTRFHSWNDCYSDHQLSSRGRPRLIFFIRNNRRSRRRIHRQTSWPAQTQEVDIDKWDRGLRHSQSTDNLRPLTRARPIPVSVRHRSHVHRDLCHHNSESSRLHLISRKKTSQQVNNSYPRNTRGPHRQSNKYTYQQEEPEHPLPIFNTHRIMDHPKKASTFIIIE